MNKGLQDTQKDVSGAPLIKFLYKEATLMDQD